MIRPSSLERHSLKKKLFAVLFGVLLALVSVVGTEMILAIAGYGEVEISQDPFVGFEDTYPLFTVLNREGHSFYATNQNKLGWFNYQEFPRTKARETYRIFTFGGSTTYGRPYQHETSFSAWLSHLLHRTDTRHHFEVINAGGISYASYRVLRLVREALQYEPDLFVVYTGQNEFLEERSYSSILSQGPALRRLSIFAHSLRITHFLRSILRAVKEPVSPEERLRSDPTAILDEFHGLDLYRRDDKLKENILRHFRYNLEEIISAARRAKVDLILINPAANVLDFSPFKSQNSRHLSDAQLAEWTHSYRQGMLLAAEKRWEAALKSFQVAQNLDSEHAALHYRLGQGYMASGQPRKAEVELDLAKELDVAPLRILNAMNEHIRDAARESRTPLIDLKRILQDMNMKRFGHSALGSEYFLDHVHPTIAVHQRIAEEVLARMIAEGYIVPTHQLTIDERQTLYADVLKSLDPALFAKKDLNLGKVLFWAGKYAEAEQSLQRAVQVFPENVDALRLLGMIEVDRQDFDRALGFLGKAFEINPDFKGLAVAVGNLYALKGMHDKAMEIYTRELLKRRRPEDPALYHHIGVSLEAEGGEEEAIAYYRRALRLNNTLPNTHKRLGWLLARRGEDDEAIRHLSSALQGDPSDSVLLDALGVLLARQGHLDQALEHHYKAVQLNPGSAVAQNNLGFTLSRLKEYEQAEEHLAEAVRLKPDYAVAHSNLGDVRLKSGKAEEAIAAYTLALQINPEIPEAHAGLAVAFDSLGKLDHAIMHCYKALELRPSWSEMRLLLAKLQEQKHSDQL